MATYLPVLLVSVTTNTVPDDSSVSTLPRAQVDYLSHEWQEEDVWKSWRNMTKQKKEIANGVRLENASWRTWWKQRNKLKTVTPETLNWLKDSDVTWLYGPLHTAVDWAPPSPQPQLFELDPPLLNPKHKPILKHRSISELLTSDLPASPLFSPAESEDEDSPATLSHPVQPSSSTSPAHEPAIDGEIVTGAPLSRPRLMHTKSDTHVTRWGPSRVFRKASPPRIDPHNVNARLAPDTQATSISSPSTPGPLVSGSPSKGSVALALDNVSPHGLPSHLASNSAGASTTSRHDEPASAVSSSGASAYQTTKKKHISFNTFVEQCIAIDKPKSESPRPFEKLGSAYGYPGQSWEYDEGYDEDDEDGYSGGTCAIESDSDSDYDNNPLTYDDMDESAVDDDDDDDDVLQIRTPSSPKYNPTRSKSKSSTRSTTSVDTSASTSTSLSNSTTSSSSSSSSTARTIQRRNSAPTRRRASMGLPTGMPFGPHPHTAVPMFRATSDSSTTSGPSDTALGKERDAPVHVTIAPIAPTFLKTSGMGDGEDADEDYPWNGFEQDFGYGYDPFGWGSIHGGRVTGAGAGVGVGGGDEVDSGYNSAGAWYGRGVGVQKDRRSRGDHDAYIPRAVRAETPVELVYVPRVGNGYAARYESGEILHREDVNVTVGDLPPRRRAQFSVGEPDDSGEHEVGDGDEDEDHSTATGGQFGRVTVTPASPTHSPSSSITLSNGVRVLNASALVTTPPAVQVGGGEPNESADPYDYFGGPDLGEDFSSAATPAGRRWTRKPPTSKSNTHTSTSTSTNSTHTYNNAASPTTPSSSLSPSSLSSSSAAASPPEEEERGRGRERSRSRSCSRSNSRSQSGSTSLSVSRSRSRSRTPSPTFMASSVSPEQVSLSPSEGKDASSSSSSAGVLPPKRVGSFEAGGGNRDRERERGGYHGGPSTGMLSPPLRGRSIGNPANSGSGTESRGRSITRTPSSSFSDRDRSSCHSSPIGSLSPEGSAVGLAGGSVFANGRLDRERERESSSRSVVTDRQQERQQRGRPRVGRSLGSSTSVSPVDYSAGSSRDVVSPSLVEAALATVAGGGGGGETSRLMRSSASSSSSSSTISEASSVATITCATTPTPTTTPMVPSNSTSSSSSIPSSIPTSNSTSMPMTTSSISGPALMSVPVKGMVVPAEPSFHVKREDHDGQVHGQVQEGGSSMGIGRAAGMLSSYLGLWPASASASGTSS